METESGERVDLHSYPTGKKSMARIWHEMRVNVPAWFRDITLYKEQMEKLSHAGKTNAALGQFQATLGRLEASLQAVSANSTDFGTALENLSTADWNLLWSENSFSSELNGGSNTIQDQGLSSTSARPTPLSSSRQNTLSFEEASTAEARASTSQQATASHSNGTPRTFKRSSEGPDDGDRSPKKMKVSSLAQISETSPARPAVQSPSRNKRSSEERYLPEDTVRGEKRIKRLNLEHAAEPTPYHSRTFDKLAIEGEDETPPNDDDAYSDDSFEEEVRQRLQRNEARRQKMLLRSTTTYSLEAALDEATAVKRKRESGASVESTEPSVVMMPALAGGEDAATIMRPERQKSKRLRQ